MGVDPTKEWIFQSTHPVGGATIGCVKGGMGY